ncbi:MAG: hypothetical protein E2O55_01675, partial [Gammaproteobacteria bacterium]
MHYCSTLYRVLFLLIVSATAQQAVGQPENGATKSLQMVRTDTPPVIDGVLDDEGWARAAMIEDLHQMQPIEYSAATERSQIYVLYDQDALYVAARMWTSESARITANVLR